MAAPQDFPVGPADSFPEGPSARLLEIGGRSVGIYHSAGAFFEVQNLCPHALAPICLGKLTGTQPPCKPDEEPTWVMEGLVLRCIWHGWEFDVRNGQTLFGIDRRRLATFPVRVENGQVIVTLRPRAGTSEDEGA